MASIRITKTMAEHAAVIMANKAYDEKIEKIKQDMKEKVTALAVKYIPAPVLACTKEYGDYLGANNNMVVRKKVVGENGQEYVSGYIDSRIDIPVPHSCSYICVNKEDFSIVESIEKERRQMTKEKENFYNKVTEILLSLRTLKKVEEELPEAVKYLDIPAEKALPAPVLSDIRNIISQIG